MQARTKQGLQTLRRAHLFLTSREYDVAMGTLKPHIESLAELVKRLGEHAIEQDGSTRSARIRTKVKHELAESLRKEYLRPIARIARSLFREDRTLLAGFRVPRSKDSEELVQAAGGIAERAEEHKERFIALGLAPDFVDRLRQATATYVRAIDSRGLDLGRRSMASAGLLVDFARAREIVRLIDDMLAPRLQNDPELLAEWRSITRFVRQANGESVAPEAPATESASPLTLAPASPTTATEELAA